MATCGRARVEESSDQRSCCSVCSIKVRAENCPSDNRESPSGLVGRCSLVRAIKRPRQLIEVGCRLDDADTVDLGRSRRIHFAGCSGHSTDSVREEQIPRCQARPILAREFGYRLGS
jgi:hypothetical protein